MNLTNLDECIHVVDDGTSLEKVLRNITESEGEINQVLDLGIDQSRILFAKPTKLASHIRYAATVGVDLMTFDNESELHKVKSLYPDAR
uniref:Orn/DAP/Arg decarboxylase 2 N-terminal domain-containing protein n=1 Tax=Timema douglasi TaxID=61478 RepID=A0A7R8Z8B2_TIMDO|nr:unnamed protein product [Timema douglasi]